MSETSQLSKVVVSSEGELVILQVNGTRHEIICELTVNQAKHLTVLLLNAIKGAVDANER